MIWVIPDCSSISVPLATFCEWAVILSDYAKNTFDITSFMWDSFYRTDLRTWFTALEPNRPELRSRKRIHFSLVTTFVRNLRNYRSSRTTHRWCWCWRKGSLALEISLGSNSSRIADLNGIPNRSVQRT